MHNGEALYASNAGKLNGLAPETYIQPQDNILDNGHFEVNQQNETEYVGSGYTVDRWFFSGGAKVTVSQDCIRLTASENSPIYFAQLLEKTLGAGVYTMAILLKNASKGSLLASNEGHNTYYANKIFSNIGEDLKLVTATFEVPKNNTLKRAYVRIDEGSADLAAFKLEPGPYFTGWPVWNYALELAKCQRYQFYVSEMCVCMSNADGSYLNLLVPLPVTMRIAPVCQVFKIDYVYHDGNSYEASNFTYSQIIPGEDFTNIWVRFSCKTKLSPKKAGSANITALLRANL